MTNFNDWATNFRVSRNPFASVFSYITGFVSSATQKICQTSAQLFAGAVHGQIHNGFLQTHLSSWEEIKNEILSYSRHLGLHPRDLSYTLLGHSKGAAKAQLNALHLVTDQDLKIGHTDLLEKSFNMTNSFVQELGLSSGFYGILKETSPVNSGNVKTIVFESPRVFFWDSAPQVENILKRENIIRIENKKSGSSVLFVDLVTQSPPQCTGFQHIGLALPVDGNGILLGRHLLKNVKIQSLAPISDFLNGTTYVVKVEWTFSPFYTSFISFAISFWFSSALLLSFLGSLGALLTMEVIFIQLNAF